MARTRRGGWLGGMEERLKTVFGPAQVSPLEGQVPRSEKRTSGVGGDWVVKRDAAGVPYLEAAPRAGDDAAPATPGDEAATGEGGRRGRR